jgi:hypothetical protein
MNDNIRYLSLQYIKGNNYDKITCIDNISELNNNLKTNENSGTKELLNILENIKKSKCEIGESLLDDLINYIEFNSLIQQLKIMKEKANKDKEKTKENDEEENDKEVNDADSKNELFSELTNLVLVSKFEDKQGNDHEKFLIIAQKLYGIFNKLSDSGTEEDNLKIARVKLEAEYNKIKNKKNISELINNIDLAINNYKKTILKEILNEMTKFKNIPPFKVLTCAKKILKYFLLIFEILKGDKKEKIRRSLNNFDILIRLYNKYLYICNNNIKKFEKIFEYNEIDNIDDLFMIVSFSKFLKKLKKIKGSLQSKDTGKIERNLIHFLDKFFNLHGFNNPDKKEDDTGDITYIINRILNYT